MGKNEQIGWCCYNCKEKFPACHDVCAEYLQAKAAHEAKREKIRKAKQDHKIYNDYQYNKNWKSASSKWTT